MLKLQTKFIRASATSILLGAIALAGCSSKMPGATSVPAGRVVKLSGTPSFTSKTAACTLWFPTPATERTQASDTPQAGKLETHIVQAKTETLTYLVVAMPIPNNVDVSNAPDFINGVQNGFLQSGKVKLEKSDDINFDGRPARDMTTSNTEGTVSTRVRIVFTPTFSYQIMAVGLKESVEKQKAQIEKVFDSFRPLA